jgi:[ribosomal protein S5]-alanine N-acetyltransferase
MTYPERIETERLLLRWPTEPDAEEMFARFTNDPVVTHYLLWAPHQSVEETRDWLRARSVDREQGRRFMWLIVLRSTGRMIGTIGGGLDKHVVQFGYYFAQDAWGHGYATEAASVMVPLWLDGPGIWRVQAFCDLTNAASARVLEKAGLTREGTLRRYLVLPNISDQPRDLYLYARVREG